MREVLRRNGGDMNTLDAIQKRQSRRTYLDTPIAPENIQKLEYLIKEYNEQSGLSFQLILDGREAFQGLHTTYGLFHGVNSFIAAVGKAADPDLNEKAGYYGELLVLEATKLELGTCFVGGTFNRKRCPVKQKPDETLVYVITVGNVAAEKGFKEKTMYSLVHRHTKAIEEFYDSDQNDIPDWFLAGIRAVQKAPSAINRQPVHFHYRSGTVTAEVPNISGQALDLGIAKANFELAAGGKFAFGNGAAFTYKTV
jgi:hypothetical protein